MNNFSKSGYAITENAYCSNDFRPLRVDNARRNTIQTNDSQTRASDSALLLSLDVNYHSNLNLHDNYDSNSGRLIRLSLNETANRLGNYRFTDRSPDPPAPALSPRRAPSENPRGDTPGTNPDGTTGGSDASIRETENSLGARLASDSRCLDSDPPSYHSSPSTRWASATRTARSLPHEAVEHRHSRNRRNTRSRVIRPRRGGRASASRLSHDLPARGRTLSPSPPLSRRSSYMSHCSDMLRQ